MNITKNSFFSIIHFYFSDFYFFPCKLCPENTFEANVNLSFIFHSVFSLCLEEKKSIPSRMNWSPPSLEPPVVPSQDMMLTHFWRRHPPPPPSTSPPTRGSRRGKNDDAIVLQMTKYCETRLSLIFTGELENIV